MKVVIKTSCTSEGYRGEEMIIDGQLEMGVYPCQEDANVERFSNTKRSG